MALYKRKRTRSGSGSISVRLEFDPPAKELAKRYDFLKNEILDMRPAWKRLLPKLRTIARKQISSRGSAAGEVWPPWKESYAKRRPNGAMMILTGRLLNSLTVDGEVSLTKAKLRFGVKDIPYARAVYFGSPKQGIASRKFIVATPEVVKVATAEVNRRIEEVLAQFPIKSGGRGASAIARRKQR